ncbi:MAG: hypothetical protein ABW101_01450 [Candidatus Thiodiazotropha sp.]
MSTDTKSSSGFWIKVIFWLIIIVLGFLYIRSLAKDSATEPVAATSHQAAPVESVEITEVVVTEVKPAPSETLKQEPATAQAEEAQPAAEATKEPVAAAPQAREPVSGYGFMQPPPTVLPMTTQHQPVAKPAAETGAAAPAGATEEAAAESSPEAPAAAPTAAETPAPVSPAESAAAQHQAAREAHEESVSKILKEFDDLRDAAQAEMEATKNRVQAERDLQDAMAPPPPPAWYGRPGYNTPYAPPAYQQGYPGGYYR